MSGKAAVLLGAALSMVSVAGFLMSAAGEAEAAAHSSTFGCASCHVPHRAALPTDPGASYGVPLWAPTQSATGLPTYTLYSSARFNALVTDITQPDGASKLCLGCHDGAYSAFQGLTGSSLVFGAADLARSHPISFTYSSAVAAKTNGGLKDPTTTASGLGTTIAGDLLDIKGKMQCTSCHDVHKTGIGETMLRYAYGGTSGSQMCLTCHNK